MLVVYKYTKKSRINDKTWYLIGFLQLGNHLVAPLQPSNSVVYELIHDSLGRLLLVDNSSALAHEVRSVLVQQILIVVAIVITSSLSELVEVSLVGDNTLGDELLDLGLTVDLPVVDVVVVTDTHGTAGPDDGADVVVMARCADSLLVSLGGTSLVSEDESGSDPDSASAHHERSSEELTVVDTTSSDDLNGAAGERRLVLLANIDNSGDEDGCGDIASVATTLTTLSANDIDAEVEALLDVLDVTDHVHVNNAIGVELVNDSLGGNTDGRDEELSALLDDNVDELVELTLGVIVVGLASAAADLGKEQINTEGSVLVIEEALELSDLLAQHVRSVSDTTNDTETTSVGDSGSELRAGGNVHAREEDGVLDLEKIGDGSSELLW